MDSTFVVEVWLQETSQPLIFRAVSTYQKGGMYCIRHGDKVTKFPLDNIFRVVEDYNKSELAVASAPQSPGR